LFIFAFFVLLFFYYYYYYFSILADANQLSLLFSPASQPKKGVPAPPTDANLDSEQRGMMVSHLHLITRLLARQTDALESIARVLTSPPSSRVSEAIRRLKLVDDNESDPEETNSESEKSRPKKKAKAANISEEYDEYVASKKTKTSNKATSKSSNKSP
jgi:hypothetical protein